MVYKVSYVVVGSEHPGAIMSHSKRPKLGDHVTIGRSLFEIEEIHDVVSPHTDIHFMHATIRLVPEPGKAEPAASSKSP